MSMFKCEAVRIDEILPHPNADRLEIARVRGWRVVVAKGIYSPGDLVVYIPQDAILPGPVLDELGLRGKLAGKEQNRVKAIRLRGELSQGVIMPLASLWRLLGGPRKIEEGRDFAEELGVTKYVEPIPVHMSGEACPRPNWMPSYTDIENVKNFPNVLEDGEEVIVTEKLHGACMSAGASVDDVAGDGKPAMYVSSRNLCLVENEQNSYWRAAREYNLREKLLRVLTVTGARSAVIFGELLGVQDLKYGFVNGHVGFRWFDLMLDGEYLSYDDADALLNGLAKVPVLYRGPFSEGVLLEHTRGKTMVEGAEHIREGVVVRPVRERYDVDSGLGRVILKSVSEDYLLRKGGTEYR